MTRGRWITTVALLATLIAPMSALGIDAGSPSAEDVPASQEPPAAEPTEAATDDARELRRELRLLARAWDEGGGQFGYPYWEKAGQRWRLRQITTTMYREYVTGYRDRLRAGCELLDAAEVDSPEARDVRTLALDACRERLDALRDQQRWLDELIRRDGLEPANEADAASLDERITELEASWRGHLQDSFRDARLATDLTQRELDERGLDRLSEDAFI